MEDRMSRVERTLEEIAELQKQTIESHNELVQTHNLLAKRIDLFVSGLEFLKMGIVGHTTQPSPPAHASE